jgi:hypothetical protein
VDGVLGGSVWLGGVYDCVGVLRRVMRGLWGFLGRGFCVRS